MTWNAWGANLEGHYDGLLNDRLRGWVTDQADPQQTVKVDVYIDDALFGSFEANLPRDDLARLNKGYLGRCAFEIAVPKGALAPKPGKDQVVVRLFVAGRKLGEQTFPGGPPQTFALTRKGQLMRRMSAAFGKRRVAHVEDFPDTTQERIDARPGEVVARKQPVRAKVFQFHSGSAVGDAVTNSLFYIQDILREHQIESEIFVQIVDPRLADRVKSIHEFRSVEDDLLIIHHSMGHDIMPLLEGLRCRKILLYHNITPPTFFAPDSPFRRYATLGLKQLSDLRLIVAGAMADSQYNARELERRGYRDAVAIPCLKDFAELRKVEFNPTLHYFEEPRYNLLFVGRICANKGQLDLLHFMNQFADDFDYPVHLTLIGHFDHSEGYMTDLRAEISASPFRDRIHLAGHVSDRDLYGHYRAADAYVSYSAHEGFGVPLLEAMTFDVPVIAFDSSAVGETLGASGVKLKTREPKELAEALHHIFDDRVYRRNLLRKQRRRLLDFDRTIVSKRLIKFLAPHLPKGVTPAIDRSAGPDERAKIRRQYIIEGPCETSYSLAIVNRKLGVALDALPNTQAALVPCEGVDGYVLSEEGVRRHPEVKPLLGMPSSVSEAAVVAMRNMFPLRPAGMLGDYRFAYFFWEESEVPNATVRLINRYLDGVIAPTEFGLRSYRNSGIRVPMTVCGGALDATSWQARVPAKDRRVSRRPFTFLHVSSGMPRKGIEELFVAYAGAFRGHDNVQLIIKTYDHGNNVVRHWHRVALAPLGAGAPAVKILFDDLSEEQMLELYRTADALVLPTRGEGLNLTAAEALALGIPVVTTRYSGHMDFLSDENALLIDYEFELSQSHLSAGEAMWARASAVELGINMRAIFGGRIAADINKKVANGRDTVARLSWSTAAEAIDRFVNMLEAGRTNMAKLKVAWVSTWNTRCGIASYSEHLMSNMPKAAFDMTIFANHLKEDGRIDGANVERLWTDRNGSLAQLTKSIIDGGYRVAVFQYNYGFHTIEQLGVAVRQLEAADIDTYVFFHKTAETDIGGFTESIANAAEDFKRATRLIVHTVEDVNRLKNYGLIENVAKLPQGALSPPPMKCEVVRQALGIDAFTPVIGCFGFLLPGKGIPELILAFSMMISKYPQALLLLVNAEFPSPVSDVERKKCLGMIDSLGLRNNVAFINDYLEIDEAMLILSAADCVVFPHQNTKESSSAAVRQGLSSMRPVLTTPLPIFDDVSEVVTFLPGTEPVNIFNGILAFLGDAVGWQAVAERQARWLNNHSWSRLGERFSNMIIGLYEDRHKVAVAASSAPARQVVTPPAPTEAKDISESLKQEFRREEFVRLAFYRATGREADREGIQQYVNALRSKARTKAEVFADICASDEAKATRASATEAVDPLSVVFDELAQGADDEFVEKAYYALLMRAPDAKEMTQLLDRLKLKALTRRQLVDQILASDEFVENDLPILVVAGAPSATDAPARLRA